MKTLDDAMGCLTFDAKSTEKATVDMKVENLRSFGAEVGSSELVSRFMATLVDQYFSQARTLTAMDVFMFGLSAFASGIRVGVEMERM